MEYPKNDSTIIEEVAQVFPDSCEKLLNKRLEDTSSLERSLHFLNGIWTVDSVMAVAPSAYDGKLLDEAIQSTTLKVNYPNGYFYNINPYYISSDCGKIDSLYWNNKVIYEKSTEAGLKGTSYYYGYERDRDTIKMIVLYIGETGYYFEVLDDYRITYFFNGYIFLLKRTGAYQ